ncbi:MAG: protein translocase SEC61 complex subunit gamma [Candidatus Helarchaeota archaeon]|nr:protein translocase SEC61 complex subunit gamma [Candidatus Helarchaeota archaeon]
MPFDLENRVKTFWANSKRVIKMARKPTLKEMRLILRITGLGVVVIGAVGFVVKLIIGLIMGVL